MQLKIIHDKTIQEKTWMTGMCELMYGNKISLHNTARKSYGMQL